MRTKNFFLTLLLAAMISVPAHLSAQVTIGSGEAPRATLDVVAADGIHPGIIVPNVTRAQLAAMPFTDDQTGAIVFVASTDGAYNLQTANITGVGFYYFDGVLWQRMRGEDAVVYTGAGVVRVNAATNVIDLYSSPIANRVLAVGQAGTTPAYMRINRYMLDTDNAAANLRVFPAAASIHNNFIMPYHAGTLPSTDLNEIITPGYYRIVVYTTNGPRITNSIDRSATLRVLATQNNRAVQTMYFNCGNIYSRAFQGNVWSPWVNLAANLTAGNLITIDANNRINVANSPESHRVVGVIAANTPPQYLQVSNQMIANNAVDTRTIAFRAVTGTELFTSTEANRVLAVTGAHTNPQYTQVTAPMMIGTGSEQGYVLTSTGADTAPVWQLAPYNEDWVITRGSTWEFDTNARGHAVFLLIVHSDNNVQVRIRQNTGGRNLASFGTSGFVELDETWRFLPHGMHMVWVSFGAGGLELRDETVGTGNTARVLRIR